MKKFLSVLTLVLALCLFTSAFAAEYTFNYAQNFIVKNNDGTIVVKFPSNELNANGDYEFQEWKVHVDEAKYTALKDLKDTDVDVLFKVVKPADCTNDAVLELLPTNVAAKLRTSNADDTVQDPATKDDLKKVGYSYYGLLAQFATNKTVDMAELAKENKALYALYKAKGHDYSTGEVRVVKEATCDEGGIVIPVCAVEKCRHEGAPVATEALGHKSLLSAAQVKTLIKKEALTVGGHEYVLIYAPNCTEEGLYEGYCANCKKDDVLFSIKENPEVHVYGIWLPEVQATCTTAGLEYRLCTLCLSAKEQRIVAPYEHLDEEGNADVTVNQTKAATCTEGGEADKITCNLCDAVATVKGGAIEVKGTKDDADKTAFLNAIASAYVSLGDKVFVLDVDPDNHPYKFWIKNTTDSVLPECEKEGLDVYDCGKCGLIANEAIVPATGHKNETVYERKEGKTWTALANGLKDITCEEQANGKPYEYRAVTTCANGCGLEEIVEVIAPEHDYDRWVMRNDISEDTPGYWIRECKVCHMHDEYIGYVAPIEPNDNGLILGEDGLFYYYVAGVIDTEYTGLVNYNGGKFYVVNGVVDGSVNGIVLVDDAFLFFANSQLQATDGYAMYDGAMFVIKAGKVDLEANGLFDYNGGKFLFAAGQLKADVNGLWLNPTDNVWYFLANGQVQAQYSGIAEYDGALFLLKDGTLATGAAGVVEQDGVKYIVDEAGNAAIAA